MAQVFEDRHGSGQVMSGICLILDVLPEMRGGVRGRNNKGLVTIDRKTGAKDVLRVPNGHNG